MTMLYLNRSKLSGKMGSMEFNMTEQEFKTCFTRWINGELIQNAFPMLNAAEREFVMNGITPEEWDSLFPVEQED